ncbi:MAG: AAA family ATPase, partial [Armatimonadetes bacterium]|nr:AAA family ATPase [Armatimonadota bacterium]
MRLKRLELVGFKTFADATELVFDQNITAIVGPNGSGKSNCADALLWVLAERRLSALRASEGTDVIFAGSERRRPLGLAEVTLTIDNSDHTLPVDFGEVSVTRRVHRNGESDYLLNGRRCRRKDVVDLFLDTGVGRQSFSVISQREIDAILSLEPEDRRRLVEEVAGVERYRSRRDETMRRLDDTAANLTRLGDIMLGLEMQVEPLAEQREQAQRYHELRQRAESLRLSLLVKDYQLLERRLLRSDEELAQYQERIVAAETALREAEAKEQQARLDLLQSDEALTTARAELGESSSRTETVGTAIRLAEERLSNLTARRQDAAEARQRHGDVAA